MTHLVSGTRIRTHNLLDTSLLTLSLDQGSRPKGSDITFIIKEEYF